MKEGLATLFSTSPPTHQTATRSTPSNADVQDTAHANKAASMALQIRPWEREVKEGLATLFSTSPATHQTATCSTTLTVDVSGRTRHNTQTKQPARPYKLELWERGERKTGNAFLYLSSHTSTVCAMEGESSTPPRSMKSPALQGVEGEGYASTI
jgi:hypothetical protein